MSLAEIKADIAIAAAQLLHAIGITDRSAAALQARREDILNRHDPVTVARKEFNAWRATHEGKDFKQQLYVQQNGCCCAPGCPDKGQRFSIKNFQFDHIKPLSKFPELALDKQNLQLLCSFCNIQKGDRT